jgi:hypothetical protein
MQAKIWLRLHLKLAIRSVTSAVTNAILHDTVHKEGVKWLIANCRTLREDILIVNSCLSCALASVFALSWHATGWKSS